MPIPISPQGQKFIEEYGYDPNAKPETIPETSFPLDMRSNEEISQIFTGTTKFQQDDLSPPPTRMETLVSAFRASSVPVGASEALTDAAYESPFGDNGYDGWSVKGDPSYFAGLKPKYHGYILNATSDKDARFRQFEMLDRQVADDRWEDGSFMMSFFGGAGGLATSIIPGVGLIPGAIEGAYVKLGAGTLKKMISALPAASFSAVSYEAAQNAVRQGGNIEKFLVDSFIDVTVMTAFTGLGGAAVWTAEAANLQKIKKLIGLAYEGVDVVPVVNKQGIVTGHKAVTVPGVNEAQNAKRLDFAQAYVDSQFSKTGFYSIPYASVGIEWLNKAMSPLVRGLTSDSEIVRAVANRTAQHGLTTEGVRQGRPNPETFEEIMKEINADNANIYAQFEGFYQERNGIDASNQLTGFTKKQYAKWKNGENYAAEETFNDEVLQSILTGESHSLSAVNNAAQMAKGEFRKFYSDLLDSEGLSKEFLSEEVATRYFSRIYNQDEVNTRLNDWRTMFVESLEKDRGVIESYMRPINELKEQIKAAKEYHQTLSEPASLAASNKIIKDMRKTLTASQNKLYDEMRSNPDIRHLIENPYDLSGKEATALKKLLRPVTKLDKQIKVTRAELQSKKHAQFLTEEKIAANKDAAKAKLLKSELQAIKDEVAKLETSREELKTNRVDEYEKIIDMARFGKINKQFYNWSPKTGLTLKSPKQKLKFMKISDNQKDLIEMADATRNTILNQTNEQTLNQVIGSLTGIPDANSLKNRSVFISDKVLHEYGFLSKNIPLIVANYRKALGRKIAKKKVFGDMTHNGELSEIIEKYNLEHAKKEAAIIAPKLNKKGKEVKKTKAEQVEEKIALRKLKSERDKDIEYLSNLFDRIDGNSKLTVKQRTFMNFAHLFIAAGKLGAVPLTMGVDVAAIVYKQGFWPSIRDGLLPMIKTFNGYAKNKAGESFREDAAHAHLANHHIVSTYADRNYNGYTEAHVPAQGKLQSGLEWLANVSNNWNGTTYIENTLQRWTTAVIQSKIIKLMLDYKAGKLKPRDKEMLLKYRFDPEEWADRVIAGWKEHDSDGNGFGGYQSNYYKWSDIEASNKFGRTLMNGVHDTIVRRGILDAPFFTTSSLIGHMYGTLKGWGYATGTRYMTPFLQQPTNINHLVGGALMFGAGAMQEPLRRLASGLDQDDNEDHLFSAAFFNSGVFSYVGQIVQDANILTSNHLLGGISSEAYRNRSLAGVGAGAIGQVGDDLIKIMTSFITGNINKNDTGKFLRMTPILSSWQLRGLMAKALDSSDLPQNFSDARK